MRDLEENHREDGGVDSSAVNEPQSGDDAHRNKVGPGNPPPSGRWKKGGPSPNPKGRPRKSRLALDIKSAIEDALKREVSFTRDDRKHVVSIQTAGIEQLMAQFAKGDRHARRDVVWLCEKFGVDLLAGQRHTLEEALTPSHQEIVDSFLARQKGAGSVNPERVKAPPELLDDDSVPSDAGETQSDAVRPPAPAALSPAAVATTPAPAKAEPPAPSHPAPQSLIPGETHEEMVARILRERGVEMERRVLAIQLHSAANTERLRRGES